MKSGNSTRFVHAYAAPEFYLPNGLKLDRAYAPTDNLVRLLVNKLLKHAFSNLNPADGHRCTNFCRTPTRMLMGFPNSEDVKSACPANDAEKIEKFEKVMAWLICEQDEDMTLQSLILEFLPCNKVVEIISVSFYF